MPKFFKGDRVRIVHWDMPEEFCQTFTSFNDMVGEEGIIAGYADEKGRYHMADDYPPYLVDIGGLHYVIREQHMEPVADEDILFDEEAFNYGS